MSATDPATLEARVDSALERLEGEIGEWEALRAFVGRVKQLPDPTRLLLQGDLLLAFRGKLEEFGTSDEVTDSE